MMVLTAILLPLFSAFLVFLVPSKRTGMLAILSVLAGLPAGMLVFLGSRERVVIPELLFRVELGLTAVTAVFLLLSVLLWVLSGVYAAGSLSPGGRKSRYFLFHFLSMAGNLGLILARDLASFYTFFALMTLTAYGLVIHQEREQDWRAGTVYIVMTVLGEVLLLAGLFIAVSVTGDMALSALSQAALDPEMGQAMMLCIWLGFGIKAGALPVHFWLPLAHSSAPAPGSAVLSGSMIKAGLLGWLTLFPIGSQGFLGWGKTLLCFGFAASFFGILMGFLQSDPKANLAYSSISQMGLMTCLVGMGLMDRELAPSAVQAVLLFAFVHAMAKGTLFLGAGLSYSAGRAKAGEKVLLLGLGVAALSIAGLPWTGGALAKKMLKATSEGLPSGWAELIPWLLFAGSVGTTLLLGRFLYLVRCRLRSKQEGEPPSPLMWWAWTGGLLLVVSGGGMVAGSLDIVSSSKLSLGELLLGVGPLALGAVGIYLCQGGDALTAKFKVPPGDILDSLQPLLSFYGLLRQPARIWLSLSTAIQASPRFERRTIVLHKVEQLLEEWSVAGTIFVLLLLTLLVLQLGGVE